MRQPERTSGVRRRIRSRRVRWLTHVKLTTSLHPGLDSIDVQMMERAIRLASEAGRRNEVPVAAVIYRGKDIIAEASNNREETKDPTGHAEVVAIRKAGKALGGWRLENCSMAVTLEPCPMCAGALVNSRLKRLVYGAYDAKAGACRSLFDIPTDQRLNHRVEVIGGVLEDRCAQLLKDFFRRRREERRRSA